MLTKMIDVLQVVKVGLIEPGQSAAGECSVMWAWTIFSFILHYELLKDVKGIYSNDVILI